MSGRLLPLPVGALLAAALLGSPAGSVLVPSASATTVAPLTTEQMVDASDIIVRGTVVDVWTALDGSHINTHATVQVERVLKGHASGTVEVVTPGGQMDDVMANVPGAPRYGAGERVLLLLAQRKDGTFLNVALSGGKYTIKQNPADGSDMVVQFQVPYDQSYDFRFIPNPPAGQRVSLSSLEARISDRVRVGWDGKPIVGVSLEHLRAINNLQVGVR